MGRQEKFLLKRVRKNRKLFAFLREYRQELFDEDFQIELEAMYRDTGAGKSPVVPALLAMATILQGYLGISDAEAVEMTVVDLRWQMVLDCLGSETPAFSQSTLVEFRGRLIRAEMDRRLLERTIALARTTKAFDWRKLPKNLRIAVDSSPLEGAGRVEDTINLLGHAARKLACCAAGFLDMTAETVSQRGGAAVLLASSVKKALDIDWSDSSAKTAALNELLYQIDCLELWIREKLPNDAGSPPLKDHFDTLDQIRSQDLEPDPDGGGSRIKEEVAKDRRVSVEDADMRHGRKSSSKLFNGYKRHIARDLDTGLIMACTVLPANLAEADAGPHLKDDIALQRLLIGEMHCDRGYISSPIVDEIITGGGEVVCKPWSSPNTRHRNAFTKADFRIDLARMTITCPAGESAEIELGQTTEFDPEDCDICPLRCQCTNAAVGRGRSVRIAGDEILQHTLRKLSRRRRGRDRLRERAAVEHGLSHIGRVQGRRARYRDTYTKYP
jgi:hypothetical protein